MYRDQPQQGVIAPTSSTLPPPRGVLASNRPLVTPPEEALERLSRIATKYAELEGFDDSVDELPPPFVTSRHPL